jgi:hypothetical protein
MVLGRSERGSRYLIINVGLDYKFRLTAPAGETSSALEHFLRNIEFNVRKLGFDTTILNVPFDNPERREFARRLARRFWIEDPRLKSGIPCEEDSDRQDADAGGCSVIPTHGVVLVAVDDSGRETCFGFMRYPETVRADDGVVLGETKLDGRWHFENAVQSPDPRYRQIVDLFLENGYVAEVSDEYHLATTA